MSDKEQSHVKWFNEKKGFGFIINPINPKEDIFVHYKDIESEESFKTLQENDKVTFSIEKGPKGFKALSVAVIRE